MHPKCLFLIVIELLMELKEVNSHRHFVKNYVKYSCIVSKVFEHNITIYAFHLSMRMSRQVSVSVFCFRICYK
jgi:hypothetical protein